MTYLFAHLSDPHLGPLPRLGMRGMFNKRFLGWLNWHRARKNLHDMHVLWDVVQDLISHKPHHICVTGDISNVGHGAEFQTALAWLYALGKAQDVSFVPGNHDAYVRDSLSFLRPALAPFMRGEEKQGEMDFPYMRVRGPVAFIGLSSAIPTGPLLASGNMGEGQMRQAEALLISAKQKNLCRVIMIHHPPYTHGATWGRGLRDARAFEAMLKRVGAELILHGHNHRTHIHRMQGPAGRLIPTIGVASASAIPGTLHHHAAYHLYRINSLEGNWNISLEVRGIQGAGTAIHPLKKVEL